MALGRPFGAKLFLEGKEVPMIGATITSSVNQASIAYIDLVPHQAITDIKPRTHVELAIRDYNNTDENFPYVTAWEGEVFGITFGKTVGGRSFSISAIDLTSQWDSVICYFVNTQQSGGAGGVDRLSFALDYNEAKKLGLRVNATIGSDASYFAQVIEDGMTGVRSDGTPKDFLDGFISVYKNISGVNDFYNQTEAKLRIRDRIILRSSGSLSKLLNTQRSKDWFNGIIGKSGGFTSLRSVVQDLMSLIFHDYVTIPFPGRVARADLDGGVDPLLSGPAAPAKGLPSTDKIKRTIGSFVFKPSLYMIPPPMCNVFFPDEYSSFSYTRNFLQEPTRLIYKPQMPQYNGTNPVSLTYVYEPASFRNYMEGSQAWSAFNDHSDLGVTGDPGLFGDKDPQDSESVNSSGGRLREAQFLTNEERLKGILLSQEYMIPGNNEFMGSDIEETSRVTFSQAVANYLFYKKRFERRALSITSHLKLSVVPGMPVLILDDSEAQQNMVAYCDSVTHRIYATQGGYTNVSLSYARSVTEQQNSQTTSGEPTVPPWYAEDIFGTKEGATSKADPKTVSGLGAQLVSTSKLSDFYKALLGDKGSKAVTDYSKDESTLAGSVAKILADYRKKKQVGSEDVQQYIATLTGRDYIRLRDSMGFKGATTKTKDLRSDNFTDFTGGAFDTSLVLRTDARGAKVPTFRDAVVQRLVPIEAYRDALKKFRGFRG